MTNLVRIDFQRVVAFCLGLAVLACQSGSQVAVADDPGNRTATDKQAAGAGAGDQSTDQIIAELIEKLGSDSYATRVRARNLLKGYGLEAFGALREAQFHTDSEILAAARYLMRSLQVSWSKEYDPKEVREILQEYGAQSETERLGRIELLGQLRGQMGVPALARLAEFDDKPLLNRRAAMLVLKQPLPADPAARTQLAEQIESIIGESDRDAGKWLLAYANDLRAGSYSAEQWRELVRQQRHKVDSGESASITSDSVIQLIRVLATRAIAEQSRQPAIELVSEHIDLVAPTALDLAEHSAWAIRHGLFPIVISLFERNTHAFHENAELLYSAAQAFDESGDAVVGQQLATDALQINPLPEIQPSDDEETPDGADGQPQANPVTDQKTEEIAYSHFQVATMLKRRGRFDWAERELTTVIERCGIESIIGVIVRRDLAMMYGEQLRHQEATAVLDPIVDRAKKDRLYQARMSNGLSSLNQISSLHHFESALALLDDQQTAAADIDKVKMLLKRAYELDNKNIDILIKMYRVDDPSDPDWKNTVVKQITQNCDNLWRTIMQLKAKRKIIPAELASQFEAELGDSLNHYAWLVANTEGDFDRALKSALESVAMAGTDDPVSRSARLDTCARCYFALGQVDEAIVTQQEALRLEPFSLPMIRQLEEFKSAQK
ncbi:hypothetical protein NHH03_04270 [Stieleria sp. TO1_6]|uniref:hypothetical protein n=1 Tax=Stieleria tagensis TaxID=2956795 RepID=UPI00209A8E65|nr:hypothetical protein [Stieleria tagensis]MCO8120942.1 hypothetical protein [Stieleria tagensis]